MYYYIFFNFYPRDVRTIGGEGRHIIYHLVDFFVHFQVCIIHVYSAYMYCTCMYGVYIAY